AVVKLVVPAHTHAFMKWQHIQCQSKQHMRSTKEFDHPIEVFHEAANDKTSGMGNFLSMVSYG
ncbi:unnamed protein product, partial [Musa textilis]